MWCAGFGRRGLLVALGTVLVSGCRDSTGPSDAVTITLRISGAEGAFLSADSSSGLPIVACIVGIDAVASGRGVAEWLDATFYWSFGDDRATPNDSVVVDSLEVGSSWNDRRIAAGITQQSGWRIAAALPFTMTFTYRFRTAGRIRSTSVAHDCGPRSTPGPPPEIVEAAVLSELTNVEPGDSVTIHYDVRGTTPLWLTAVELGGACDTTLFFGEEFAMSRTRTLGLGVPSHCRLGVPLTIDLFAYDIGLRGVSQRLASVARLVDVTPPTIWVIMSANAYFLPANGRWRVFVADHLGGTTWIGDNHSTSHIHWRVEPNGLEDSIPATDPSRSVGLAIPVTDAWLGGRSLTIWVTDSSGNRSATLGPPPDSLVVYPTRTPPQHRATIAGEMRDFRVDSRRNAVYVLQVNERRLQVLSLPTLAHVRYLDFGAATPIDFDLTPSEDSLVVASWARELTIVDLTRSDLPQTRIPIVGLDSAMDQRPRYVRATSRGTALIGLSANTPSGHTLVEVNLATGASRVRSDAGPDGTVAGSPLERSADGRFVALNGGPDRLQLYDAVTDLFGLRASAIPYNHAPQLDSTGTTLLLGIDVYDRALNRRFRSESFTEPNSFPISTLTPLGDYAYHLLSAGILRTRISDGALVDRLPVPHYASGMRMSSDGRWLLVADNHYAPTTQATVFDLR